MRERERESCDVGVEENITTLVLREQTPSQRFLQREFRMQEFYKGCKYHKFVYALYSACHTVKGSVISKRGNESAACKKRILIWFYIPARHYAILQSFLFFFFFVLFCFSRRCPACFSISNFADLLSR